MKEKKQYKMLQLDEEVHTMLRDYAKRHGFVMKLFVQALIKQAIATNKKR
jgi:hypothetical protein